MNLPTSGGRFAPTPPTIMHVDINSCFATVEQQANPFLRGKPMVVAAYAEDHGCILAASREAKQLGIKTGMRVREACSQYPQLIVLPPDPEKYRFVNKELSKLLSSYTPDMNVESIDEMVMNLAYTPALRKRLGPGAQDRGLQIVQAMRDIAREIKERLHREVGEWLTVSIGIAPNRYLAKVASGLHKPDGLDVITPATIVDILTQLALADLCGIKQGSVYRLWSQGITTPVEFYRADAPTLMRAFRSILGYQWWLRLHGWEDGSRYKAFGTPQADQKTFGQSHAMAIAYLPTDPELHQVLAQLVSKMARRLRRGGGVARGVHISCYFVNHGFWQHGEKYPAAFYADCDFYDRARQILIKAPKMPVRILAVTCFDLAKTLYNQESLLPEDAKKKRLTQSLDAIADRWGERVVVSGRALGAKQKVLDRIAFGKP